MDKLRSIKFQFTLPNRNVLILMINITNKNNDTQNMNLIPSHMAFPCILRKIFLRDVAFCLIRC